METIQFQYADGEYARALRRYRVRRFRLARDLSIAVFLAVIAYVLRNQGWPFWFAAGAVAFYLFMVALSVGLYPELASRLRPHLKEPYTIVFSEREIAFSTPSTESKLPWSTYRAWARDPEYVYLSLAMATQPSFPAVRSEIGARRAHCSNCSRRGSDQNAEPANKALQLTRHCSAQLRRGRLMQHHRGSADTGGAVPRS